jgi:hypothetical protein
MKKNLQLNIVSETFGNPDDLYRKGKGLSFITATVFIVGEVAGGKKFCFIIP